MDSLKDLLANAKQASERTRSVIYLLLVVCATYLGAWLNTGPASWTDAIVKSFADDETVASSGIWGNAYLPKDVLADAKKQNTRDLAKRDLTRTDLEERLRTNPTPDERLQLLQESGIRSYADIQVRKEAYDKKRIDQRYVSIPIVNITIFVYDMTLIMGISMVGLLLVLLFSMRRELENLRMSFGHAVTEDEFHFAFKYLSSLLILRNPAKQSAATRYVSVPQMALLIPLLLLSYAMYEDFSTFDRVRAISPGIAQVRFSFQGLTVIVAWITAVKCYFVNFQIGKLWFRIDQKVGRVLDHDRLRLESFLSDKSFSNTHAVVEATPPQEAGTY